MRWCGLLRNEGCWGKANGRMVGRKTRRACDAARWTDFDAPILSRVIGRGIAADIELS
jgi:hypothetical protein